MSSSGHLALLPKIRGIVDPGVAFDLSMHVGTALALILYFRKDILQLVRQLINVRTDREAASLPLNMLVATIVTVIFVLIFKDLASSFGRKLEVISFNLFFFGILMFLADHFSKVESSVMSAFDLKKSILIGLFQGFAVFPGVSRSGSTLTISRWLKLSREEAAKFSFLLSLPIIIGGFIYKIPELSSSGNFDLLQSVVGISVSFVVGILTIHVFLKVIKKMGLIYFGIYRVIFAIIILFTLD